MRKDTPSTLRLKDYTPPDYLVETVELHFDLREDHARVRSRIRFRANAPDSESRRPLVLHGQALELVSLALDGETLAPERYRRDEETLTISRVPRRFELQVETRLRPQDNTALEGLYRSQGMYCTQCEAEGFRRITYYLDRPDVMATFVTTIEADKAAFPVLLSNGNLVAQGEAAGGRHWVRWHDPHKKPCYLFALVAGDLVCLEDRYTTASGREVDLRLYVEPRDRDKCAHAMASLKKAMRWDEERFGLEYDLDIYMIVAVSHFNMGAMENKGLNLFNTACVLARPETATDADYAGIEGVIAHEYFHNWTGNRVTCRDWFQLSLKEGLTVFRDQEFSADMGSRPVKRIHDVRQLRSRQFPEDAGPMAHPVRPEAYVEVNNFYTATVYEKGAEVVRMIHTLVGSEGFRKGLDLYFRRHDGQAVTTDDFVQAMADANGVDLGQFKRWYSQAGTPVLHVHGDYDATTGSYTLTVRQSCPPTPGQAEKHPFHIPLALGLLDADGGDLPLRLEGETRAVEGTRVLELTREEHRFRFVDLPRAPVPSLLRGFSAPVKLETDMDDAGLAFLFAHDRDPFNRWEAGQQLAVRNLQRLAEAIRRQAPPQVDAAFIEAMGRTLTLTHTELDPAFIAETLQLPTETYLAELAPVADPVAIHEARRHLMREIAARLERELLAVYGACRVEGPYRYEPAAAGRRSLRNRCLYYLTTLERPEDAARCLEQYRQADNMTEKLAALSALARHPFPEREAVLQDFYQSWKDEPLVVDKWFALQAAAPVPDALARVQALYRHPAFDIRNPNRVRALIGSFALRNPRWFHDASGEAYAWVAERVLELDALNPQVAARLVAVFNRWRKYDESRQALMRAQLERILATDKLSKDVYEIVSKAVATGCSGQ